MPAGDFNKTISLILQAKAVTGKGVTQLKNTMSELQKTLEPVNTGLKTLESNSKAIGASLANLNRISGALKGISANAKALNEVAKAINKIKIGAVVNQIEKLTTAMVKQNRVLAQNVKLLEQRKAARIGARTDPGTTAFKRETDEFNRLLRSIGDVDLRTKFENQFAAINRQFQNFEDRVEFAKQAVQRHFQTMFPQEPIVKLTRGMQKFTGQLDINTNKIRIAHGSYRGLSQQGELLNTVVHELVESMLFQLRIFDRAILTDRKLAHEEAKRITNLILQRETIGTVATKQEAYNLTQQKFINLQQGANRVVTQGVAGWRDATAATERWQSQVSTLTARFGDAVARLQTFGKAAKFIDIARYIREANQLIDQQGTKFANVASNAQKLNATYTEHLQTLQKVFAVQKSISLELGKQAKAATGIGGGQLALPAARTLALPAPPMPPRLTESIERVDQFQAMWGKLANAIRQASAQANLFGDTFRGQLGTINAVRTEIQELSAMLGTAFRPNQVFDYNASLTQSVQSLRQVRAEIEQFAAANKTIEKAIADMEKLDQSSHDTSEEFDVLREKIVQALESIHIPYEEFERLEQNITSNVGQAERFRVILDKLSTKRMGALNQSMETLRGTIYSNLIATQNLLTQQNQYNAIVGTSTTANNQATISTDRMTAAHVNLTEMLQKEAKTQQDLITEYEALAVFLQQAEKAAAEGTNTFANQDAILRRLMGTLDRANKLRQEGIGTSRQFFLAQGESILQLQAENQQRALVGRALENEIRTRRMSVQSIELQIKAQRQLIQTMGRAPQRFEFEQSVQALNQILRTTEAEIVRVQRALSRIKGSDAEAQQATAQLNQELQRLRGIAAGTDKQIANLNRRLRSELPRSADAARAASRLTLTGFIEMTKSQAAWMAGFTVIFGTIYKFSEALRSQIDIMNQTARVMRTMRSETMTTAEMQVSVAEAIEDALRRWGQATEDIAQALYELGSAGLTAEQSLAALPTIMNLVVGGESDVTQTTRTLAGAYINLTQSVVDAEGALVTLGDVTERLGGNIQDASDYGAIFARIADVMAAAARDHLVEIEDLNQGLKFMTAVGLQANLTFEEMVGMLSVLGDNMIRSGMAGRSMRRIISAMTKDANDFAKAFGIAIDPEAPIDFMGILEELSGRFREGTLSVEQLGKVFQELGLRGAPAFVILLKKFESLQTAINTLDTTATGAAEKLAEFKLDTPALQAALLRENILALIREAVGPFIEMVFQTIKAINEFAQALKAFNDFFKGLPRFILGVAAPMATLVGLWRVFVALLGSEFIREIPTRLFSIGKSVEFTNMALSRSEGFALAFAKNTSQAARTARALGNSALAANIVLQNFKTQLDAGHNVLLRFRKGSELTFFTMDNFKKAATKAGLSTEAYAQSLGTANLAIVSNTQAQRMNTIATGQRAAATTGVAASNIAAAGSTGLFTVATNALTAAWAALRAVMVAHPVFFIITILGALYLIIKKVIDAVKLDTDEIKKNNQERLNAVSTIDSQIENLKKYANIVESAASAEDALEQVRREGLDTTEGITVATTETGEAYLTSAKNARLLLEVQEALKRQKIKDNFEETGNEVARVTGEISGLMNQLGQTLVFRELEQRRQALQDKLKLGGDLIDREAVQKELDELESQFIGTWSELERSVFGAGALDVDELRSRIGRLSTTLPDMLRVAEQTFAEFGGEEARKRVERLRSLLERVRVVLGKTEEDAEAANKSLFNLRNLRDYENKIIELRKSIASLPDTVEGMSLGQKFGAELSEVKEKYAEAMAGIEKIDDDRIKAFEDTMKRMSDSLRVGTDNMTMLWRGFTQEQQEEHSKTYRAMEDDIDNFARNMGISIGEARQIIRDRFFKAISEDFLELRESMRELEFTLEPDIDFTGTISEALDRARREAEAQLPTFSIVGIETAELVKTTMDAVIERTVDWGEVWASIPFDKMVEEMELKEQNREFEKLLNTAKSFIATFDLRFDLESAKGLNEAIQETNRQLAEVKSKKKEVQDQIVENTNDIIEQKERIQEIRSEIIDINKAWAEFDIKGIYKDALSDARDLADEINTAVDRQNHLNSLGREYARTHEESIRNIQGIYRRGYAQIESLEDQLNRGRAQSFEDFNSQWKSLINARISGTNDLIRIQEQLAKAEAATTKDAQKIKDLKTAEANTRRTLLELSQEQARVEFERLKEYERQDEILESQMNFVQQQVKQATELSEKYRTIASDESRTLAVRAEAAQKAAGFGEQILSSSKELAELDTKRAKMAQEVGKNYKTQQDLVQMIAQSGHRMILDALQQEAAIADKQIDKRDDENKTLLEILKNIGEAEGKLAELASALLTKAQDQVKAHEEIVEKMNLQNLISKELIQSAKERNSQEIKATTELLKQEEILKRMNDRIRQRRELLQMIPTPSIGGTLATGGTIRAATGRLVSARVTRGEGWFTPQDTQKNYSKLAQLNSGSVKPLPSDLRLAGIFQGPGGIDNIHTMLPEGSYVLSHRGMQALRSSDMIYAQETSARKYQEGGVVQGQGETPRTQQQSGEIPNVGSLTINIVDGEAEESVTVFGEADSLRRLDRAFRRERLKKVKG